MSAPKKLSAKDRQAQMLKAGDKVRILLGEHAGKIMTVRDSTSDEAWLVELPKRFVMSKGNLERIES